MDFKKILAGMSAMAIASTVAATAFADEATPATPDATTTVTTTTTTPTTTAAASGTTTKLYEYTKEQPTTKQTIKDDSLDKGTVLKFKTDEKATYVKGLRDGALVFNVAAKNGEAEFTLLGDNKNGLEIESDGKVLSINAEIKDPNTVTTINRPVYGYKENSGATVTKKIVLNDSESAPVPDSGVTTLNNVGTIKKSEVTKGSKLLIATTEDTKTVTVGFDVSGTFNALTNGTVNVTGGVAVLELDDDMAKVLTGVENIVVKSNDGLIKTVQFAVAGAGTPAHVVKENTVLDAKTKTIVLNAKYDESDKYKLGERTFKNGDKIKVTASIKSDVVLTFVSGQTATLKYEANKQTADNQEKPVTTTAEYVVPSDTIGASIKSITADKNLGISKVEYLKANDTENQWQTFYTTEPTTDTFGLNKNADGNIDLTNGVGIVTEGDSIVVKTAGETGSVSVKCGDKVIGTANVEKNTDDNGYEHDVLGLQGKATIKFSKDVTSEVTLKDLEVTVTGTSRKTIDFQPADNVGTKKTFYQYVDPAGETGTLTIEANPDAKAGDKYAIYKEYNPANNSGTTASNTYKVVESHGKELVDSTKNALTVSGQYGFELTNNATGTSGSSAASEIPVAVAQKGFTLVPTTSSDLVKYVVLTTKAEKVTVKTLYTYAPVVPTEVTIDSEFLGNVMDGDTITVTTVKGAKVTFNGKEVVAGDDGKAVFTVAGEDFSKGLAIKSTEEITLVEKTVANPLVTVKVKSAKVASTTTTTAKLTWEAADKATGYIIYKYNPTTKTWDRLGKAKGTTYTVKNLTPGTSYKFAVKSFYRDFNNKVYRQRALTGIKGTTKKATVGAPSKLTVKNSAKGKVTISYAKSKTAGASYKIMYKTSAKAAYKTAKYTKATRFSKAGFKKGQTVYVAVKAYKKIGGKTVVSSTVKKAVKIAK